MNFKTRFGAAALLTALLLGTAVACGDTVSGVRTAMELAGQDGCVLCFGSLYSIGAIRGALDSL